MKYKKHNESGLYELSYDSKLLDKKVNGKNYSKRDIRYDLARICFPKDITGKYLSTELYGHLSAKLLLSTWLSQFDIGIFRTYSSAECLDEHTAIYTELPIFKSDSLNLYENVDMRWEIVKPYTMFNTSKVTWEISHIRDNGEWWFIPDITVLYKGVPIIFIEIIDSHDVTEETERRIKIWYKNHDMAQHIIKIRVNEIICLTQARAVEYLVNFFNNHKKQFVDARKTVDNKLIMVT